ncbi:hypothetical protein [Pseudarthrobacter sp. GA104]|uniref:hypothetical protein n=1 Tax=Pseudarthrobacter sp. GA104 TaxID=2676311 RepID=UPI0012F76F17|nr:hypothetical protein [Pseudarthrobacter sp. GA104]MUU69924.1 hypothetical protein [Pseudarthrobacter sp. GA104]
MTTPGAAPSPDIPQEALEDIQKSFLHMRFRGGRFEGATGMPMAAMGELASLNEIIMELAKVLWRRKLGKQRVRGGYPSPPTLRVEKFAQGSTIPLIQRDGPPSTLLDDPYDASRDLLERTFWAIVSENKIPDEFPTECIDRLRRFGKGFHSGEAAGFLRRDQAGTWSEALFTSAVRQHFWESFDTTSVATETLIGKMDSLDRNKSRFMFRRESGQALPGGFANAVVWDDLHKALGSAEKYPFCRLSAQVERDYLGRPTSILDVNKVEVIEVEAVGWKDRFLQLADDAYNAEGGLPPVAADSLERADLLIEATTSIGLYLPAIFASSEGGINLVWQASQDRTTVYIEPDEPYEIENVPFGSLEPIVSDDVTEVAQAVKELVDA